MVSKRRNRRKPVSAEVRREILGHVASGRKACDVAREYDVDPSSISRWKALERAATSSEASEAPQEAAAVAGADPAVAEPATTGRYSKSFKVEVLRQVASGRKGVEVARQYGIPETTLYRWKRAAQASGGEVPDPKSTRPASSGRSPIDASHRELVLSLKQKHPNMGLAQIQNQLRRFHAIKLSRQMIGRIFGEAGIPLQKTSRKDPEADSSDNRFEMSRPNELWAIDFTEFWIHSEKAYAVFLLDDFSRFCLGFALSKSPTAELAIAMVEASIQKYGRPERVLSDRGSQFHSWRGVSQFDDFLAERYLIDHTVTKADHPFTNGKIEAFHRTLQAELLDVRELESLDEAQEAIGEHVLRYNFLRTHMGIGGLVPADRYFGMVAEAQRALEAGLEKAGPSLQWLRGLVSHDGRACRRPQVLELVVTDSRLELVVLGRRFSLGLTEGNGLG